MKIFLISLSLVLMISCTQNSSQNIENLPQPVAQISPVSNQTVENNTLSVNETVAFVSIKLPTFPTPEKVNTEDCLKKENTIRLKKFGLYDLEKQQISKDDLEIRVWQISDLYMRIYKDLGVKESVFILKRTNGNWSAKVFRNTVNQKSNIEKLIKTKLDTPESGWENVWQNFVNNELLTFPDSVNGEVIFAPDYGSCIIESKVDGIFKTFQHAGSQEIREIRHTAKTLNIIADEFNLEDFQASRKFE
ncbi:MAG TPA: hypothetical protein VK308_03590 [Pyrinomonadaceae bacterium]|nr:hypothetical protein [Pyrinomonadaceae bacterium]